MTPQPLFVADATRTVAVDVDGLVIPDERVVSRVSRADFMANQNFGSRLNVTVCAVRSIASSLNGPAVTGILFTQPLLNIAGSELVEAG